MNFRSRYLEKHSRPMAIELNIEITVFSECIQGFVLFFKDCLLICAQAGGGAEGEHDSQADSALSTEPDVGSIPGPRVTA